VFPDSPFAYPVSSFQQPVPLVQADPDSTPLLQVQFNASYLPYIIGCLEQLLLQTTWDTTDPTALGLMQARCFDLLYIFSRAYAPTLPAQRVYEDENKMPFRTDCDCEVFAECCDGTEKQLVTTDMINKPGQPGGTQPQPQPGGGTTCNSYSWAAGSAAHITTIVSSGDTLLLHEADGSGASSTFSDWRCIDGEEYFAGLCSCCTRTDAGDPEPSLPHGALLWGIDGTYYQAVVGTPFTVPGGITNKTPFLLANLPMNTAVGSYNAEVCVTNNAVATWSKTFDFRISNYGWVITPTEGGHWTPGVGFGSGQEVPGDGDQLVMRLVGLPAATYTAWAALVVCTSTVNQAATNLYTNGAFVGVSVVVGPNSVTSGVAPVTGSTLQIEMTNKPSLASDEYTVTSVTIQGTGVSPF
jgi:hypothetical protein